MSHTQHTPGPWALSYDNGSTRDVVASPDPLPICSVRIHYVGREQYHANANLIAAAPRLLSAAQRVTAAFRAMGQPASVVGLVSNLRAECEASMLELDEAIKQATGEAE